MSLASYHLSSDPKMRELSRSQLKRLTDASEKSFAEAFKALEVAKKAAAAAEKSSKYVKASKDVKTYKIGNGKKPVAKKAVAKEPVATYDDCDYDHWDYMAYQDELRYENPAAYCSRRSSFNDGKPGYFGSGFRW
jgi:hypothetical protein